MMKMKRKPIKSKLLNPSIVIGNDLARELQAMITAMHKDTKRQIIELFNEPDMQGFAADANISSQARMLMNRLIDKWGKRFDDWARDHTGTFIRRVNRNAEQTMKSSLKEWSENITLKFDTSDERMMNVLKASTEQAAQLITAMPAKYLDQVQGNVMRSITTGNGLKDLVPQLTKLYNSNYKHAKMVALDQTRKAYTAVQVANMQRLGMKKFEWIHSGGGQHPRKQHQDWDGKIFSIDNPPVDKTFGPVMPGDAINCRCKMRLILDFGVDEDAA